METLKRVIIKEELVAITGDFIKAVILQQFLYWTDRMKDIDKYLEQENKRLANHGYPETDSFTRGWIYKTADELSEETMLNLSAPTIRKHIKLLILKGYLAERRNPKFKYDRTTQYRINLNKINSDLIENGYHLEGYKNFGVNPKKETKEEPMKDSTNGLKLHFKKFRFDGKNFFESKQKNFGLSQKNFAAIPDITSDISFIKKESEQKMFAQSPCQNYNELIDAIKNLTNQLASFVSKTNIKKSEPRKVHLNNSQSRRSTTLAKVVDYQDDNLANNIIKHLNNKLSTNYKLNFNTLKLINARLKENYSYDDFITVINKKCDAWKNTQFAPNLKPRILFNEKNFDEYLNEPIAVFQSQTKKTVNRFANFEQRNWDFEEIERLAMEN